MKKQIVVKHGKMLLQIKLLNLFWFTYKKIKLIDKFSDINIKQEYKKIMDKKSELTAKERKTVIMRYNRRLY